MIVSCNADRQNLNGEYYFNPKKREAYYFDKTTATIYNFPDSSITKVIYDIEQKNIRIGDEVYNYRQRKDTLFLTDFSNESDNLKLVKFDFKPFDLKKIASKSFGMIVRRKDREFQQFYEEEQFLQGDSKIGFQSFYHRKHTNDTIYGGYIVYKGKLLNKFPVIREHLGTSFILCNYEDKKIEMLSFFKGASFSLSEITPKKANALLYGTWKQVNQGANDKLFREYAFYSENDSTFNFKSNFNKVKRAFDLSSITFKRNGTLQRYFQDTVLNYNIKFGITNKYIFVEKFNKEFDFETLKIDKLTKDTLVLQFYNFNIQYKYVRDSL
jgi:hypothetical protein